MYMSLVSVSELARMVGVSRQAISWQIKAGKLPVTKGKINTDNPAVAEYIASKSEPKTVAYKPDASFSVSDDDGINGMSKHYWDTRRAAADARYKELKNATEEGRLVAREVMIRGVWNPLETFLVRILTDGAKTVAATIHPLVLAGATKEETEISVRKELESFVKPLKDTIKRAVKPDV
jgi:hypothetical protein